MIHGGKCDRGRRVASLENLAQRERCIRTRKLIKNEQNPTKLGDIKKDMLLKLKRDLESKYNIYNIYYIYGFMVIKTSAILGCM
jgi:hypothetical protein